MLPCPDSLHRVVEERVAVLVAVVAVSLLAGLIVRARESRIERRGFVPSATGHGDGPGACRVLLPDLPPGSAGAVVVLGTRACATCARTHALLVGAADAAGGRVAVRYLLIEDRLDLASDLDIRSAPTVLLTDPRGVVTRRHEGGLDAAGARTAVTELAAETAA
jgi:hypothetical protein